MTRTAEEIADSLTSIQRSILQRPLRNGCLSVMGGVSKFGLCNATTGRLTKLGLTVRSILESRNA